MERSGANVCCLAAGGWRLVVDSCFPVPTTTDVLVLVLDADADGDADADADADALVAV